MTVFNPATANMIVPILPPPAQNILNALANFGITYPGNAVAAPSIEITRLSDVGNTDSTPVEYINSFLTEVYPKLQPNSFTSVALSFASTTVVDPATQSTIYNFYTLTGNQCSDIVPPAAALSFNAVITDLEATYSHYAQSFIMGLFDAHMNDVIDNPHHDSGANLVDVWIDFFQGLYNAYVAVTSNPVPLSAFILNKTTTIDVATNPGYTDPGQALFIVPVQIILALIAQHNNAIDSSIHPTLQSNFTAETTLPVPTLQMSPDLFLYRYPVISTPTTIIAGTPPKYAMYYGAQPLNNSIPKCNGTLFVQATVAMNSPDTITIFQLINSETTDSLTISKLGGVQGYQISLEFQGNTYTDAIPITINEILFVILYSNTGMTITHVDQNGNQQTGAANITNFYLSFDTIQVGIPVVTVESGLTNVLQDLTVYPAVLASDQISLLFNTVLS